MNRRDLFKRTAAGLILAAGAGELVHPFGVPAERRVWALNSSMLGEQYEAVWHGGGWHTVGVWLDGMFYPVSPQLTANDLRLFERRASYWSAR